jgi:hypothetical protein
MATNEQYFAAIILSIIATSTFIAGINLAYNGHFPDLSTTTGSISTEQATLYGTTFTKMLATGILIQGQNFTDSSMFDSNITIIRAGTWAQSTAGYTLIADAFLDDPLIIIRNVLSSGNVYTVSYMIKNAPETEFYITPRHLGAGKTVTDIRLEFKPDGIHIPKYPLIAGILSAGDDYFYPSPGIQQTLPEGSIIETSLNDVSNMPGDSPDTAAKNSLLTVSKDGTELFSVYVRDLVSGVTSTDVLDYAGAGSHIPGFMIMSINAPIQYTPNTVTIIGSKNEAGLIEGAIGLISLLSSMLSNVGLFLANLGTILGYSISSDICPIWVTAIVMTPQLAGLGLIVAKILRGTS